MLVIALMFVITLGAVNAAPESITVKRAVVVKDLISREDKGLTIFETTNGDSIYCMDIDKKSLVSGQGATLVGDGDAGLLYILRNGYPNKSFVNNVEIDKYITQIAVWWYIDESKLSNDFKTATDIDKHKLRPIVKDLVAKARSAKSTAVKPSMNVSANDKTMKLTSDSKYYESEYMSATLTGTKTYNVELSGATKNTVVVDEQGNIGTTMNSGEKFKVRIPASEINSNSNITVKFSASATVEKAKIYKPTDASYQRVVGLYNDVTPLTNNVTLTLNNKRTCEFADNNYQGKDGNIVDKKTYNKECGHVCEFTGKNYYGKDGNVVDKKTYNKECNHSCEYVDGKYHGKDGSVVDKTEFDKQCNHVCEFTNNKYYGKNGNVVDKKTYIKECKRSCEVIDGKYYGKDGSVVDKDTYSIQCEKHVCDKV